MSEFVKISDLLTQNTVKKYQIQGKLHSNMIKIANIGHEQTNDICIFKNTDDNITCELLAFVLSDDDIVKERFYIMGYLMKNNDVPIGTLNFVFKKSFGENGKMMQGKFEVVLSNSKNENLILQTFDTYPGNDNVAKILTENLNHVEI